MKKKEKKEKEESIILKEKNSQIFIQPKFLIHLKNPSLKNRIVVVMEKSSKIEEPAIGIPYNAAYQAPMPQQYYVGENPYQSGAVPPNAVVGDPKGIPLQQTIYRDTPAPFNCVHCGSTGITSVKHKPSLAAFVGCMMPMMLGVCFLCPSMDCLWHKYHYCPSCNEKVADFEKSDPCLVMDPPQWVQESFALPA